MLALTAGCGTLDYYGHVAHGQASLLVHRKPIEAIVADKSTDPKLRDRLAEAEAARRFASDHLGLPRNKSYTSYVDLGRPYATWNVFATPEFSVEPITHCFPFAGCVAYVGFFDKQSAERERKKLAAQGNDTAIEGSAAYSTLGWFADPILSSMLRWSDDELDGVIFHELAHQRVYAEDDTAFNESFATFVQREGLREWRESRGLPPAGSESDARDDAFAALVLDFRERLRTLYARELDAPAMREAKAREIDAFRERYRHLRATEWKDDAAYDRWVDAPINNARLVPFGLYDHWVPAFERLFMQANGDWPTFYGYVSGLARLSKEERDRELDAWLAAPQRTAR
ncbi:MAG TPA: aminopeptidase [Rhodanobacteraceae bacterium]|nr:aminopeptidase [Rhodanobacteraceae bacterium]